MEDTTEEPRPDYTRDFDPYLLLTPRGDGTIKFACTETLQIYREQGESITKEAARRQEDHEQFSYDADEHTLLKTSYPELLDTIEVLLSIVHGVTRCLTPAGLIVAADPDAPAYRVYNTATDQWLQGAPAGKMPPVDWLNHPPGRPSTQLTAAGRRMWENFTEQTRFYGGFWQAWETALKAEKTTMPLPGLNATPATVTVAEAGKEG